MEGPHIMSIQARKEYVEVVRQQYQKADKAGRAALLDQITTNCEYHRKYAIRLLGATPRAPSKRRSGRPRKYDAPELVMFIVRLWKAGNLACGKRLVVMIPLWLPWYEPFYHRHLPAAVKERLLTISSATIDRILMPYRKGTNKIGLATTKPGTILKKLIPVKGQQWDETRPGFLEVDTVAHCGTSVEGMFVYTITAVDIATQWTEMRAVWGKGKNGVLTQIKDIEQSLPFPLRGLDCDNGGEFLNWHVYEYLTKRKWPVDYTRSREYQKNDNAHVEGKNWTHVRQYFGYERFDEPAMVALMNALYTSDIRLLLNGFLPSVKLTAKERNGAKVKKTYDSPKTPLERVLTSPDVTKKEATRLLALLHDVNPFELQERVKNRIGVILNHVRSR